MSDQFISSDFLSDSEAQFPLPELLKLNYFTRHRSGYYEAREAGLLNKFRNYVVLLEDLREIFEYNQGLAGMQLRYIAEQQGMSAVLHHIAKYSHRNKKRNLDKYRDFLPVEDTNEAVNKDYLNVRFQMSVARQLAA